MTARFRTPCPDRELITALVDGELEPEAHDRLLGHVAGCPRCRADVVGERRARDAVRSLLDPQPTPALLARLRDVAGGPDLAGRVPADLAAARVLGTRRPRPATVLGAAASVLLFVVGAVTFVGAAGSPGAGVEPTPAPAVAVVPAVDRFAVEHAVTAGLNGEPALADESAVLLQAPGGVQEASDR